ncbi:transcriptional regulator, GntR family [Ruminiclostridium papyrosolvens DSM 2782]|uniref:Transcriptional regulator, GntR family n=1 Tax=Ruminiclostridium papyrosolvens DSM 2782 TaxID=588581 RepID=F1TE53_9FIRM|nr:GntR family transcriptional regulator [Ruminiclostridium papyrosolvens]EGD47293.1 transcriptional regulator, GntR family [Ruminiclostridium papyrosolvens DSM 2782]WES34639.1 GntR family transcriptional regulator [Ruminiclostridium papyrosolvens DSM 2782]
MKIIISNTSGVPIYEQIKEQIKSSILSGEIEENQLLPSLRQLARELKISVLTTTRAYTELEQEGYVTNVQGKGCYVLGRGSELIREQLLRDIEENLSAAIKSARRADVSEEELVKMLKILMEDEDYE